MRALVAIALAVFLAACRQSPAPEDATKVKAEVQDVIDAKHRAYAESLYIFYPYGDASPIYRPTNWATYSDSVHRIDTSGCPDDFRRAWGDYLEAVHGVAPDFGRELGDFAAFVKNPSAKTLVPHEPVKVALDRLKHRCRRLGADPPDDKY